MGCTGAVTDEGGGFMNGAAGSGAAATAAAGGTSSAAGGTSSASGGSASGGLGASAGGSVVAGGGASSSGGGAFSSGGASTSGGGAAGGACSQAVLPAAVQTMLTNKCVSCHGSTPLAGLPSLSSYADLTAPSKSDPSKTYAVVMLARIQSTSIPMPPAPGAPVAATDISALQDFISQGYPKPSCPTGTGGTTGMGGSGGAAPSDPLGAMPVCTSKTNWTGGNRGSASMNPGAACINCHSKDGEAPKFSIAGTLYPTGHEPDLCNGVNGTQGAQIVIIGADGKMVTLTPNAAGNFSSNAAIKTPYQAKVTYMGRERIMAGMQTSGDCNSCHTQNGSSNAPGRITLP